MTDGTTTDLALPPAQVEELLTNLDKAVRAHQLYLPNNPMYQRAIQTLREGFIRAWTLLDDLVLEVSESEFRWEGSVVYRQPSRSDSVAWVLFKDGVRSITFLPGVEEDEVLGLLDVIRRGRTLQAEDNDDLLTLLWEKDFQRIRYAFVDLASETAPMTLPTPGEIAAPSTEPSYVTRAVQEETPARAGMVRAEDFDTTLYFLDEREIEYLRGAVAAEYAQDLRRNVLSMLCDILELQPYPTARSELISILESFLPYLLSGSDFRSVAYVLREAKAVLQRARELLPEHGAALEALPGRLSQPEALAQLLQSLDEATSHPSTEELAELFGELRGEALPTLLSWVPKLANAAVRNVLEAALRSLASANASQLVQAFESGDPAVVLEAARLAGRMKFEPAVPALAQALGQVEAAIRLAAVQALADIASPAALQALERGLEDPEREVRLVSVRVIAQQRSRSALARIAALVQGRLVRAADLTEKMAFFEAYGSLIGDPGVATLDPILNRGGFLKRKDDPETRACAAMALGKIGTPAARDALQRAAADKEPLVRNAVSRALRGLAGAGVGA